MLTKVELPQGYKRLINKEKERKDVIQIIDDEGFLREVSFDDLVSHPTTLAGYGITDAYISNGTIYLGNQSITPAAVSSLGTAAYKNYTASVTQGSIDLPTSDAVFQAIGAAVSSALHYRGISSTIITDGGTETAVIGGQPLIAQSGDVVIYSGFEFLWENNVWNKLGDDTSFALKTVQITGDGIYITGGGDLTTSRSLGLSQAAIDALALASTAYQKPSGGIPAADLAEAYLPLTAGSMKPLTGDLYLDASSSTRSIYVKDTSGTRQVLTMESGGVTTLPGASSWLRLWGSSVMLATLGTNSKGVYLASSGHFFTDNGTVSLGSATNKWSNLYANAANLYGDLTFDATSADRSIKWTNSSNVTAAALSMHANGNITIGYNQITNGKTTYIYGGNITMSFGSSSAIKKLVFANGVVRPNTNNEVSLGMDAFRFTNVYATNLFGSLALSNVTGADDLKAIEALTGTSGFLKKTAANTWALTNDIEATSLKTTTEEDAMFTSRQVPSVAVGDVCKITSVKGKSVVWNQLIKNPNFTPTTSGWSIAPNWELNENTEEYVKLTKVAGNVGFSQITKIPSGHKCFVKLRIKRNNSSGLPSSAMFFSFQNVILRGNITNEYFTHASIETAGNSIMSGFAFYPAPEEVYIDKKVGVNIIDLTQMFGEGKEPTTVEEFEALYPLPYYDYNTGELINNTASGVEMLDSGGNSLGEIVTPITEIVPADKPTLRLNQMVQNGDFSQGRTGWELRTTSDTMDIANGEITVTKGNNNSLGGIVYSTSLVGEIDITHKYYIASLIRTNSEGTEMALGFHASSGLVSGNTVLSTNSTSYVRMSAIVSPSAATDRLTLRTGIGSSANGVNGSAKNVICIDLTEMYGAGNEPTNITEVEELIGTGYIPYTTGEDIPNRIFPVGMKSAGIAYDEWSGSTATKRIGSVDLGTLTWVYESANSRFYTTGVNASIKRPNSWGSWVLCAKYVSSVQVANDKSISVYSNGRVYIKDTSYTDAATFKAAMSGVLLYYELKEPETYIVDALPDILVPFESGGTMRRLPVDTSEEVAAPMVCDFQYGANIGDVIKSINNSTEEYRKKSDNNFTSIETDEIHCTGDIEANGNLTINDVIASAINAQGEMSIPTQMPSTIELGRVFMYYDEAVHQLCIRESDGTIKTIQFT